MSHDCQGVLYLQKLFEHYKAEQVSSPVANKDVHRLLLLRALQLGDDVKIVDIRVAYLNAKLDDDEVMYMKPKNDWPGIPPNTVLRILRCIPGLKQSGHKWHKLLTETMKKLGFKQSEVDPCLYLKHNDDGPIAGVASVHVDDMLMTGDRAVINRLREELGRSLKSMTWKMLNSTWASALTMTSRMENYN